jgi:hypothetical protein
VQAIVCPEPDHDGQEKIMKIRAFFALAVAFLAVSACVIEPVGGRGFYGQGHERGVWRG